MAHTFKVKWATRSQAEEVAKILDEGSRSLHGASERLKARFGSQYDIPWMQGQPHRGSHVNLLDKRDTAFSKTETKMLMTLKRDGFRFSHTDEDGFDVYVQEAKDKGLGLVGAAS